MRRDVSSWPLTQYLQICSRGREDGDNTYRRGCRGLPGIADSLSGREPLRVCAPRLYNLARIGILVGSSTTITYANAWKTIAIYFLLLLSATLLFSFVLCIISLTMCYKCMFVMLTLPKYQIISKCSFTAINSLACLGYVNELIHPKFYFRHI